jgi:dissimilatory sulfite reductase (desulfoviridin) alpha/beta subunit
MRIENLEIAGYIAEQMARGGAEQFKRNVMRDLDQRRDENAPEESRFTQVA